jgi:hypothetical protein
MTENHNSEPDDSFSLGELFAEVLDDMDVVAAAVTDTEIETRLHQLLQPPAPNAIELEPQKRDAVPEPLDAEAARWFAEMTSPRALNPDEANRAWWELAVARAQVERERASAEEFIAAAENYLDAAVEQAGRIVAEAREEGERLTRMAREAVQVAQTRATEVVADAEALAGQIIGDAKVHTVTRLMPPSDRRLAEELAPGLADGHLSLGGSPDESLLSLGSRLVEASPTMRLNLVMNDGLRGVLDAAQSTFSTPHAALGRLKLASGATLGWSIRNSLVHTVNIRTDAEHPFRNPGRQRALHALGSSLRLGSCVDERRRMAIVLFLWHGPDREHALMDQCRCCELDAADISESVVGGLSAIQQRMWVSAATPDLSAWMGHSRLDLQVKSPVRGAVSKSSFDPADQRHYGRPDFATKG